MKNQRAIERILNEYGYVIFGNEVYKNEENCYIKSGYLTSFVFAIGGKTALEVEDAILNMNTEEKYV